MMFRLIPSYRVTFKTVCRELDGMKQVERANAGTFRVSERSLETFLSILRMNGLESVTMTLEPRGPQSVVVDEAEEGGVG